ncbi:MAG: 3-deoxy-7-phosphoheptulonate synthase [Nitrospiraceae bacterium]|nr:MAG: 3-deoxy-7-phosphoheptulonate synthase [Nitrospiraceae bacterium]
MSFQYIRKMPQIEEILQSIPLTPELRELKRRRDKEIIAVFKGESNKFIVIIGPCSADNEDGLCDYVSRLARIQEEVQEKLILIPRIYTNKPRTTGEGYKGMAHQPKPSEAPDMVEGLKAIRSMHIRAMKESHLTAADEMLYPPNYPYLEDILSYVAVGARSVENQLHRLTISGLDVPAGMKNPTSGDIEVMMNSVQAAQLPHTFVYNAWEVKTTGNPLTHAILRGAVNPYGTNIPNYHYEDLYGVSEVYKKRGLKNPAIIVDTNHANSNKEFQRQPRIAKEVMLSRRHSGTLRKMVKGLMIESYIEEGSQKISDHIYGKSITDPCLSWDASERLLRDLVELA